VNVFAWVSLLSSIIAINLGLICLRLNQRSRENRVFALLCFSLAAWGLIEFGYRQSTSLAEVVLWNRMDVFWVSSSVLILHFTTVFTGETRLFRSRPFIAGIHAPFVLLIVLKTIMDLVGGGPVEQYWGYSFTSIDEGSIAIQSYYLYAFLCVSLAIFLAFRYLLSTRSSERRNQAVFVVLLNVASLFLALGDVSVQLAGYDIPEMTIALSNITIGLIVYGMWRYRLFMLTPIDRADDIIGAISDGIAVVGPGGVMELANEGLALMSGYTTSELIGMKISRLLLPDETPSGTVVDVRWFEKPLLDTEMRLRRGGDEFLPVSVSVTLPRFSPFNNVKTIIAVRDMSERLFSAQRLKRSLDYHERLMEILPHMAIVADRSGRVIMMNSMALETMVEHDLETEGDLQVGDLLSIDVAEALESGFEKVSRTGGSVVFPTTLRTTGWGDIPVEVGISHAGPSASDTPLVIHIHDLRRRQRKEEAALRQEKLKTLGYLAAGIAHDFNNILTSILSNLSIVQDEEGGVLPDEARRMLATTEEAANRARSLTHQLLTFSRGGEPIRREVDIGRILPGMLEFILPEGKGEYKVSIQDGLPPVMADEGQLAQVVQNIVGNALAASTGSSLVEVSLKGISSLKDHTKGITSGNWSRPPGDLSEGAGWILLEFRDEGTGMDAVTLERIFEPYFTTRDKGTGLGMTVVRSVIDKHEGLVHVISEVGSGTTMSIFLPACEREGPEAHRETTDVQEDRHYSVLLLDDEASIRKVVESSLGYAGHRVTTTATGEEFLERFHEADTSGDGYDLVIVDLTIHGGMGGARATAELHGTHPDIPAIVISGYSNDPIMANHREHGFAACLAKPFRMKELKDVVQEVMGRMSLDRSDPSTSDHEVVDQGGGQE